MKTKVFAIIIGAALLLSSAPGQAAKITFLDDGFLDIHGFLQPRIDVNFKAGDTDKTTFDIYVRRARLLFGGRINKHIRYFFGALLVDMGRGGNYAPDLTLGDAWLEFFLNKQFRVNAGLIKLPFGRHMQLSGGKLHGLDFHGFFLKRVVGDESGRNIPHRDIGLVVRGLLFSEKLDYRFAVLDGREPGGDRDYPRFVGRVGVNVFDSEPEYHWNDSYFGKRKILSFGVSYDLQPGVAGTDGDEPFFAFAVDGHADLPFGKHGLIASVTYAYFGPPVKLTAAAPVQKPMPEGHALMGEVGFRIFNYEPLFAVEWFEPKSGDKGQRLALMGGFNWWIKGHKANIKLQAGGAQVNGQDDWSATGSLQGQIFF